MSQMNEEPNTNQPAMLRMTSSPITLFKLAPVAQTFMDDGPRSADSRGQLDHDTIRL